MSYILDALKRADAERERGHVPGLHTHNVPPGPVPRGRARWLIGAGLLVVAASAASLAVWWLRPPQPAQPPAIGTASDMAMPPPVQPVTVQQVPAPPSPAPHVPVQASPAPAGAVLPLLAPPPPAPLTTPPPPEAKTTAPSASRPNPTASAAGAGGAHTPASPAPPAETATPQAAVRSFGELSPEARASLPPVNVSGSTYSKNPALRMLIANGKVVQEGQEIAPDLVLETIGPRSAVLNHRGTRYSIGY